ncbi:MAG: hypothetical protein BECKG1743D_GA0114223_104912 [Candidatus Kentron sp. G]|nr:MAG: hypothetical protein BECKG1743F_GA0114225_102005 [Candidatus Kentron sp. G]VFN03586.1 MAG: hypothetical protein BECKG1743D_GA0114223_104912 [Candidatus Kentron sp. G]VFN03734.1 MAG: hypothetical protein BECKG1743E_GA0114224_106493 [Candidatus Kentron sp. G]
MCDGRVIEGMGRILHLECPRKNIDFFLSSLRLCGYKDSLCGVQENRIKPQRRTDAQKKIQALIGFRADRRNAYNIARWSRNFWA